MGASVAVRHGDDSAVFRDNTVSGDDSAVLGGFDNVALAAIQALLTRLQRPAPIEINYELAYENVNPDFAVQIERLRKAAPDAIVLWADARAAGHLVTAIRKAGFEVPIYTSDRVLDPLFLEVAGDFAEGIIAASPFLPKEGGVAYGRFEQAYVARVVKFPTLYAGHAYDGACMLIAAIRQAGLNRYRIRDALAATRRFEGVTGTIVLDRVYSHRGPVSLATVRLGAFVYGAPQPQVRF